MKVYVVKNYLSYNEKEIMIFSTFDEAFDFINYYHKYFNSTIIEYEVNSGITL